MKATMRIRLVAFASIVCLQLILGACSQIKDAVGGKALNRSKAGDLIAKRLAVMGPQILQVGRGYEGHLSEWDGWNDEKDKTYLDNFYRGYPLVRILESDGLVRVVHSASKGPVGYMRLLMWEHEMWLVPTDKGTQTMEREKWRFVPQPVPGKPQAGYWEIPVADRKLVEVTGISEAKSPLEGPTMAVVEFTWQFVRTTVVNTPVDPKPHPAKATFKLYDDGWRLVNIDL
jgi:hypothetical protein